MKKFYIEEFNFNIKIIESNDPTDIVDFLKDKPDLNKIEHRHFTYLVSADLRNMDLTNTNLSWTDLSEANLKKANLTDSNLENIYLYNTIGDGERIKTLDTGVHIINEYDDRLQIGRSNYTKKEWLEFNHNDIDIICSGEHDHQRLKFWKEWKPRLINMGWLD